MKKICTICGLSEDQHHIPEWREQPDTCVCDPLTWDVGVIPEPCEKYQGDGGYCLTCEHEKECHKNHGG